MKLLFFIVCFLLISSNINAYAVEISNPKLVDMMTAEVVQNVNITLEGSPNSLELSMYIPQDDEQQKLLSISADYDYSFIRDEFGNRMLQMKWDKPDNNILFSIKSIVEVNRRERDENYEHEEFLKPNSLVNSDDVETRKIAESLIIGKNEFERIASMTSWVNENLEYDMKYYPVNLSSRETLNVMSGVCDEYSTLLSALARSVGYYSPYIVGYAYGNEGFRAHGWVSVNGVLADPTWAEMPVDATHIKFAVLEDASYSEVNISVKGNGNIKKPSVKTDTIINIINIHTNKAVKTNSEFLPSPGEYTVLKIGLSSDGCILTRLIVKSCIYEDGPFFEGGFERNIYFCGNKTIFSVLKAPDIKDRRIICPVTVFSYDGASELTDIAISGYNKKEIKMDIERTVFERGEMFSVYSPESHIFTEDGQYGFENAVFEAIENTTFYVYNSGAVNSRKITVMQKKPIDVYLQVNNTVYLGDYVDANVTIENKLNKWQNVFVKMENETQYVPIPALSSKTIHLRFSPENANDNVLQIIFSSLDFSTSTTKMLNVLEKDKGWPEIIADFFAGIVNFFERFFTNMAILINSNK